MKQLKLIQTIFYGLLIVVLVFIALIVISTSVPTPRGVRTYTVMSGSMEPSIPTGSLVLVKPQSSYQLQDVITFKLRQDIDNSRPKFTTTHRVIEATQSGFVTKGDANDATDSESVSAEQIVGKVVFHIPLVGYPVSFAKTRVGLITLVVIPATIIVYGELLTLKQEIVKEFQRWQKRRSEAALKKRGRETDEEPEKEMP